MMNAQDTRPLTLTVDRYAWWAEHNIEFTDAELARLAFLRWRLRTGRMIFREEQGQ